MQPLPQHFCWDSGQQTRSPHENTNRSMGFAKNQITPPFIFTLVFHLLPESYPTFPVLSPVGQTEALIPGYQHKHVEQRFDLWWVQDRPGASCNGGSFHKQVKWSNDHYDWKWWQQFRSFTRLRCHQSGQRWMAASGVAWRAPLQKFPSVIAEKIVLKVTTLSVTVTWCKQKKNPQITRKDTF